MITEIADYFNKGCGRCDRFATTDCATQVWAEGLAELRRICAATGLDEQVKWGHPCYVLGDPVLGDRNIAILGAFRHDFRLNFFQAGLMKDPDGVLEKQGENTRFADMIRFTSADRVRQLEPVISGYLAEAVGYAEAGLKEPPDDRDLEWPPQLVEALAADPELSQAWDALTPGRRKAYVLNLSSAKRSETRAKRIRKFRGKIMLGQGPLEQ